MRQLRVLSRRLDCVSEREMFPESRLLGGGCCGGRSSLHKPNPPSTYVPSLPAQLCFSLVFLVTNALDPRRAQHRAQRVSKIVSSFFEHERRLTRGMDCSQCKALMHQRRPSGEWSLLPAVVFFVHFSPHFNKRRAPSTPACFHTSWIPKSFQLSSVASLA